MPVIESSCSRAQLETRYSRAQVHRVVTGPDTDRASSINNTDLEHLRSEKTTGCQVRPEGQNLLIDDARSVSGAVATLWSCAREQLLSMTGIEHLHIC